MLRRLLSCAMILIGALSAIVAADDAKPDAPRKDRKGTVAAVGALASQTPVAENPAEPARARSAMASVRALANQNQNDEPIGRPGKTRPREARPDPDDAAKENPPENARKPGRDLAPAFDQFGFPVWEPSPFVGPQGFGFSRVGGFRSFGYGYRSSYYWPAYYATGCYNDPFFPAPIVTTISGPVVTRYDDPLGRQFKMVDEGIRKNASHPPGLIGFPR